jgi:TrmH family RNA methyltransferase
MLTSTKNPRIQHIRKLQNSRVLRYKEGLFVVEGVRLVEEAFQAGKRPTLVLYTEDISIRGQQIIDGYISDGVEVFPAAPHVLQAASDTQTSQGILAILPIQSNPIPDNPDFIVIPDGVRDPGNLGTILRTALAAGVSAVILPPESVDPFSPKVIRAAMGAHFKLPIISMEWEQIHHLVNTEHLTVYLTETSGGQPHHKADFQAPLALIIGGEAHGVGQKAQILAVKRVTIPMAGGVESLNTAIAAAVLMFEVVHQRQYPAPNKSPRS